MFCLTVYQIKSFIMYSMANQELLSLLQLLSVYDVQQGYEFFKFWNEILFLAL